MQPEHKLIPPKTLAEWLDIHERTVTRLTAARIIPSIRIGPKLVRYNYDAVVAALQARSTNVG